MKHQESFIVKENKKLACKLKMIPYGLRQSPRMWYKIIDSDTLGLGFTRRKTYHHVNFK